MIGLLLLGGAIATKISYDYFNDTSFISYSDFLKNLFEKDHIKSITIFREVDGNHMKTYA